MEEGKVTPVVFTGNAREYFGIWIVNLLLSIITLGIYSAWAKVRRKKYFYQHTFIDGVAFDYHASPIAILKGRMLAFAFFVLYSISVQISPMFSGLVTLVLLLAMPWIIMRSLTFNARNSSYRGLRFDFNGKLKDAISCYIAWPLLMAFTLGLIYPLIAHRRNRFIMQGHRFGLSQVQSDFSVGDFYKVYLKAFAIFFVVVLAVGAIVFVSLSALDINFNFKNEQTGPSLIIWPLLAAYLFSISVAAGYLRSRVLNLIWKSSHIDHVGFDSILRARGLIWLYLSNLVAIIFSLGLLVPWAHVRTARYHADRLALIGVTDFDQFIGEKKAEVKAAGEEIGEMFDIDLAFG